MAPRPLRSSTASRLRWPSTVNGQPFSMMFFAMPWPMSPTPMKPIRSFMAVIPFAQRAPPVSAIRRGRSPRALAKAFDAGRPDVPVARGDLLEHDPGVARDDFLDDPDVDERHVGFLVSSRSRRVVHPSRPLAC